MSARIDALFRQAHARNRPVLIAYLCIGDPSLEASYEIARALLDAGVDILELGAPFSDPSADGPVIAQASMRAIRAGGSLRATIEVGARLRRETNAPLVLFGYANPIVVIGEDVAIAAAAAAGLDALLVVDLPPEESTTLRQQAALRGLDVIALLSPTSREDRVEAVARCATGFVYYVSVAGVTGRGLMSTTNVDPFEAAAQSAARIRDRLQLPVVIGFGIDNVDKARRAVGRPLGGPGADGVVVGSALVRAIEEAGGSVSRACSNATAIVAEIRAGLDAASSLDG